jgi:hypothetical protein
MSLRKIYKLAPKLEPAAHDLGHCPKPSGRQYAWRIAAPGRRARIQAQS